MITLRTAPTVYNTGQSRQSRQPMLSSYALGGCHQGNGFANDVFAMQQRRPQFGAICCVVAAALATAVAQTKDFDKALESNNPEALLDAIAKTFINIPTKRAKEMVDVIKAHKDGFKALIGRNEEDPVITTALKAKTELWAWLDNNGYTGS